MLFKIETALEAYKFLKEVLKNVSGLGDLVVCTATWIGCEQLAYALLLEFPGSGNQQDSDTVVIRAKNSTVTFLIAASAIEKARLILPGKSLLLVTEGMPEGTDALCMKEREDAVQG